MAKEVDLDARARTKQDARDLILDTAPNVETGAYLDSHNIRRIREIASLALYDPALEEALGNLVIAVKSISTLPGAIPPYAEALVAAEAIMGSKPPTT